MTDYAALLSSIESLAEISCDMIPVAANAAALLYQSMEDINWAGFYFVKVRVLLHPYFYLVRVLFP